MEQACAENKHWVLYILMRNDLASLNAGKACAQAAHAGNVLSELCLNSAIFEYKDAAFFKYKEWTRDYFGENRQFGTTIVLSADIKKINYILDIVRKEFPLFITRVIHDPTYPIKDGQVTHLIPLDTCGIVFGDPEVLKQYLGDLELMP